MHLPEESDNSTLRLVECWAARPSAKSSRTAPVHHQFRFLLADRSLFFIAVPVQPRVHQIIELPTKRRTG
jgi:hypothetical protein